MTTRFCLSGGIRAASLYLQNALAIDRLFSRGSQLSPQQRKLARPDLALQGYQRANRILTVRQIQLLFWLVVIVQHQLAQVVLFICAWWCTGYTWRTAPTHVDRTAVYAKIPLEIDPWPVNYCYCLSLQIMIIVLVCVLMS